MKKWYLFLWLFVSWLPLWAGTDRSSIIEAKEEFKWGVFAFNHANYSDAILSFEKAISLDSADPRVYFWLGLAYYVSGFENEAVAEWRNLIAQGYNRNLLEYWINAIEVRRSLIRPYYEGSSWEVLQEICGLKGLIKSFSRPTMLRADKWGGFYLVSFGQGAVYQFNANGKQILQIKGGRYPLTRPFDVLPLEGKLFVSDYARDAIQVYNEDGTFSYSFGVSGIAPGCLLAPSYLSSDSKGFIYICEWGNQRISKFDQKGKYILSFGGSHSNYSGLKDPTGVVVKDQSIYVADKAKKGLDIFDLSGNYMGFCPLSLENIEGLTLDLNQRILVTTDQRFYAFEPHTQRLIILQDLHKTLSKSLSFDYDANGQLLVADFNKSIVTKMAPIPFLYEGLFVRIARVIVDEHPRMYAEIVVEDRYGRPIVGLDSANFILREGDYLIGNAKLEYAGFNAPDAGVSFILDKSQTNKENVASMKGAIRKLVVQLNEKQAKTSFFSSLVSPVLEKNGALTDAQAAKLLDGEYWTDKARLDLAILQAGGVLCKGPYRRSIILLSDGRLNSASFVEYKLIEISQFLKNNGIAFHIIQFGLAPLAQELGFLANETGGEVFSFSSAQGTYHLLSRIFSQKSGRYLLSYDSPNDPEFGCHYIPLSVEVNFNKRTGMGGLGYFAPFSRLSQ